MSPVSTRPCLASRTLATWIYTKNSTHPVRLHFRSPKPRSCTKGASDVAAGTQSGMTYLQVYVCPIAGVQDLHFTGSIYPNAIRQPAFSRASIRQSSSPRGSGTKAQIAEAHLLTPSGCLAMCCKDLEDSEQLHALQSGQAEKVQRGKGGSCLEKQTLRRRARQLVECRCMPLAEQASISSTCGMDIEPDGRRNCEENTSDFRWAIMTDRRAAHAPLAALAL